MGMTLARWAAGVTLACALVAGLLLPFPAATQASWLPVPPAPLVAARDRFTDAAARTAEAVRAYRSAQALHRWSAAGGSSDTASIRVDASVPVGIAAVVRRIAAEQWAPLGATASAVNAEIFIYVDTTTIPRAMDGAAVRRRLESRRPVDVAFALPEATDGAHCVTLVRLRGSSPEHVAALRSESLVGVCGFFAAFGMPGDGVRRWLTTTGYRAARRSDWHVARAPAIDPTAIYGLSDAGGRCLTSQAGACLEALQLGAPTPRPDRQTRDRFAWVIDGSAPSGSNALGAADGLLGDAEPELLLAAVRELGAERFGRFWRSASGPDSAFQAASGISLDAWTQAWATRTYGTVRTRPTIRVPDVVWLAVALPLLIVVAARRRERVLAERLLPVRA